MSEILGLSAPGGAGRRVVLYPARRGSFRPRYISAQQLGDAYEALAAMALAEKLAHGDHVPPGKRLKLLSLSKLPPGWHDNPATEAIWAASADELGKGGVIGSISHAVTQAAKVVSGGVATAVRTVARTQAQVMKAAAPIISAIPVLGPAAGKATALIGNQLDYATHASVGGVFKDATTGGLGKILGTAAGDVGTVVQTLAEGVVGAGSGVANFLGTTGGALANGISGILGAGKSLFSGTAGGFMDGLKAADPSAASIFSGWGQALDKLPIGQYLGKAGGKVYSMIKDGSGLIHAAQHDPSEVSSSVSQSIPEGGITAAAATMAAPSMAGNYAPGGPGGGGVLQGAGISPAGISMASGPEGSGSTADPVTGNIMQDMVNRAMAAQASVQPAPAGPSPLLILGAIGLLGAGYYYTQHKPRGRRA